MDLRFKLKTEEEENLMQTSWNTYLEPDFLDFLGLDLKLHFLRACSTHLPSPDLKVLVSDVLTGIGAKTAAMVRNYISNIICLVN